MRKITVEIPLYSVADFNLEENKRIKDNVLERYRHYCVDGIWYEDMLSSTTTELEKLGFDDIDINYSLSYSQGDGARITCTIPVYRALEFLVLDAADTKILRDNIPELSDIKIKSNSHRYYHENTIDFEISHLTEPEDLYKAHYRLAKKVLAYVKDKSIELYQNLSNAMDDITSDEYILENFNINDYEFTKDGKMFEM